MKIFYTTVAEKQLEQLPRLVQKRIANKMRFYENATNPLVFAKHLKNYDGYRFRVGDYRIIFEVYNGMICVLFIHKRDEAYKDI